MAVVCQHIEEGQHGGKRCKKKSIRRIGDKYVCDNITHIHWAEEELKKKNSK